jgi:integrase
MATGKITVSKLNDLQGWLWDDRVVGLGIRRQTKGLFYYLRYRHNGSQVMRSIGRHGSPWTPDTARNEALRLLGTLAGGTDPFAETLSGEAFGAEIERYLERKRPSFKPRYFTEVAHHLRKQSAPLHRLKLADIDRRAIATLLGKIETDSGPTARNRLRSSLSAFFAFAIAEGLVEHSPVQGTGKAGEANSRERVLTPEEMGKLWHALGDDAFSDVVRLLLLTGQRRTEIGKLAWAEVDLTKAQITLPASRVKNGREHTVPLSRQVLAIIERIPQHGEFVFGAHGFTNWADAKARLDQRVGIAPWHLHDCRRSAATYMGELGVLPHIIEAILNHRSGHKQGVAGRYNWAKYADAVRDALQRWADHLDQITAA